MNKLAEYGMADATQVDDEEDNIPKSYKEYKEKLEQEERLEFDSYQHDLDSQEYIYEFDYLPDNEDDDTVENDDKECWKSGLTGEAFKHLKDTSIDSDQEPENIDLDNNCEDECMIEVKDPDLDGQRDILSHHNGIYLMQTDRSAAGLNLKNCVHWTVNPLFMHFVIAIYLRIFGPKKK